MTQIAQNHGVSDRTARADNVADLVGLFNQVARYDRKHRPALIAQLAAHPRTAELLRTFPAACLAATDRRRPEPVRAEALRKARLGRPLSELAATLDIPLWLRRFPPEAFTRRPPLRLIAADPLPGFHRQLAKRAPSAVNRRAQRVWLTRLFTAAERGDPEFALWAAIAAANAPAQPVCPRLIALYAFYSKRPGSEAGKLLQSYWTPNHSWRRAAAEAESWFLDLLFSIGLDFQGMSAETVTETEFADCRLTPLLSPTQLFEEGRAMRHCIAQYWRGVFDGRLLLFRIRAADGECANFEVRPGSLGGPLRMVQMLGPHNRRPSPRLRDIAERWVSERLDAKRDRAFPLVLETDQDIWSALWTPYWRAWGRSAGPAAAPGRLGLTRLIKETHAAQA